MARPVFPSGRKPLLLLILAAIGIGGVWWWQRPPPDPAYRGRRLSEYLAGTPGVVSERDKDDPRSYDEQIGAFGPAGVKWLAYKVEHGSHPFFRHGPLPLDHAPDWLRRRTPEKWGGLQGSPRDDERDKAAGILRYLGADAAPAIPALSRCLESDDSELVRSAAIALQSIGPVSWPVVEDFLHQGNQSVRIVLLNTLPERLKHGSDADVAHAVQAMIKAMHDPNSEVRAAAAGAVRAGEQIQFDINHGNDPRFDAALPHLLQLLSEHDPDVLTEALRALWYFQAKASPAVPRFIELIDADEQKARSRAAHSQSSADQNEQHFESWAAIEAMSVLGYFGADAAPALPALSRCLDSSDRDLRIQAAITLQMLGSTSWPTIQNVLDHGSPRARLDLLRCMDKRLEPKEKDTSESEAAPVIAALVKALRDPSSEVRATALDALHECRVDRMEDGKEYDRYDSAIPALVQLVSDVDPKEKVLVMDAIAWFEAKAAAAIPSLIELLGDDNSSIRDAAVAALLDIDVTGKCFEARLRVMLHDANADRRAMAEDVLFKVGLLSDEESASGVVTPPR